VKYYEKKTEMFEIFRLDYFVVVVTSLIFSLVNEDCCVLSMSVL